MKKVGIFLCSIAATLLMTGCGAMIPDLTEEETDLISEYAVGVLLKYDKAAGSRLVDTSEYNVEEEEAPPEEETPKEEEAIPEEEVPEEEAEPATEVVDVSEEEYVPSTIEEYYGISDFTFQYMGYELVSTYPEASGEEIMFFSMDATEGTQLLVLKFQAANQSGSDQTLSMISHGARFRISVNGERSQGALATMLLDDMQTFEGTIPAGGTTQLVSIVEVPTGTNVETIDFVLRGGESDAVLNLQ